LALSKINASELTGAFAVSVVSVDGWTGRFVASAADDNQVRLWRLPKMEAARTLAGHGWRVTSVAFSPDGNLSLSGSEDDSLKLWDVAKGQEIRSFRNGLADVTCVAFSPDGRFGLSGSRDKAVKLWNLAKGREVQQFNGHSQPVRSVAFTQDGSFVVSASEDGTIKAEATPWRAVVEKMDVPEPQGPEVEGRMRAVLHQFEEYVRLTQRIAPEIYLAIQGMQEPDVFADTVCAFLFVSVEERQDLLETLDVRKRLDKMTALLEREIELAQIVKLGQVDRFQPDRAEGAHAGP